MIQHVLGRKLQEILSFAFSVVLTTKMRMRLFGPVEEEGTDSIFFPKKDK